MDRPLSTWSRAIASSFAALVLLAPAAFAQEVMQLDPPASEYTLRNFKYTPPKTDGWRQMANIQTSLSLIYALQPEPNKIETIFGVAMEAHEIPEGVDVGSAAGLAATSANQMAEQRKVDLVARSPIEAVPSIDNLYTYRLMVKSPVAGQPDGYEIYYVMLSPDKKQYLVIQCIAKNQDYGNQVYFTEFYGSLASLRYVAPGAPASNAAAPAPDAAKADAPKAAAPAPDAAAPHVHDPSVPHEH